MKIRVSEVPTAVPSHIDLFVCAASFEDRSTSIPLALDPKAVGTALVSASASVARYSRKHEKRIREHFGSRTRTSMHSGAGPLTFADSIRITLGEIDPQTVSTVLADVTTFTRESLLILLKMLREWVHADTKICVAYTGAERYETGRRQWLSADYRDVRSVLGYPGELNPTQNLHLIVLLGFEVERAARAIRAFEPSILSIGHGDEEHSISPELYRRNMELFARLATIRPSVNRFTLSLDDPFRAAEEISRYAGEFRDYNTVVVPMNTKLSTVGAAISVWRDPRVQLAYVAAKKYNVSGYSRPGEFAHVFELPVIDPALEAPLRSS